MPHTGATVLYIDDDAGLRALASRVLTRNGFVVTAAEDGGAGVALAAGRRFDLIAVDHYMPGMDGLETLDQLQRLPGTPPIVYVTGSEESRVAVAAMKAGAADYVVKSVGADFFDLLASSFRNVLDRTRLERAKTFAEDELRAANARLEALLAEVNHRVANSLQIVSAMVRLQSNGLQDPAARAALEDTQRRIGAIAQVHRRLYTSDKVTAVDMREYLQALVEELGETWTVGDTGRRVTLDAEPIELPTDRAVSLGVIVTELVSNACKYAYGSCDPGEVRVTLASEGPDRFVLAVEDDGVGMTHGAPARGTGVGTRLIRAMAQSLQSTLEYDTARPRGTRATLSAALA